MRIERVQRVDADRRRASCPPLGDDGGKVGKVAHAPVALRAHRVELHRRTPGARAGIYRGRAVAAGGCNGEQGFGQDLARLQECEPVIAAGRCGRQREVCGDVALAVEFLRFGAGESPGIERTLQRAAVLAAQAPGNGRRSPCGRKVKSYGPGRRIFAHHHRSGKQRPPALAFGAGCRRFDFSVAAAGHAHRREQSREVRRGNVVVRAPDVVIIRGDAVMAAKPQQRFALSHATLPL